jgi:hypothetical protein
MQFSLNRDRRLTEGAGPHDSRALERRAEKLAQRAGARRAGRRDDVTAEAD